MTTRDHGAEPLASTSMVLAMATVVCSSFGWNVFVPSGPHLPLALIGSAFLPISTLGWIWCERRGTRALAVWLAVLIVLSSIALWLSHLSVMIVVFPSIFLAAAYGGTRWGILVTASYLALSVALNIHWGYAPIDVYSHSTGFIPAAIFAIVLARLVVRERDARQQIRRYAVEVEELATTRERNRIARDIHDSVGHYLTVVHVQIEAARATVATDPTASNECLVRAQELARQGLSELRRSVSMLRSGAVEQRPFGVALAALVEDSRNHGLETALEVHGTPRALTPAIEFSLFRAAQEALTNVTRHAHATHARCTLRYTEREVALEVSDDGVGAVRAEGGFGLIGLRERAALVGGTVTIKTAAGRGFAVEVRVPT